MNKLNHIKVVADILEPWISVHKNKQDNCDGIQCNMIKYLSRSLNFTFEIHQEDQGPGYLMANGTWTGMLRRFVNKQADISASPFAINYEPFVKNIVDFSHLYNVEESVVMTTFDDSHDLLEFDILTLLDRTTMVLFSQTILVFTLIYCLIDKYLLISKQTFLQRFSSILFLLFGTILGKDIQFIKYFKLNLVNYFLQTSWLFLCLQLYLLLASDITAKLNLKKPSKQIETIEELVDSKMSLVVPPSFFGLNSIREDLLKRIIEKLDHDNTILPISKIVIQDKWAVDTSYGRSAIFLYEVPLKMLAIIHSKNLKPNTKFRFIEERYGNPVVLSIASSTRLPKYFRQQISFRVSQYYSTGIIAQDLRRIQSKSDPLFDYKMVVVNNLEACTFSSLIYPLKLILIICSISMVILCIEFAVPCSTKFR